MLLVMLTHTILQLSVTAQKNLTPFGIASQSTVYGGTLSNPNNAILPPISNDFDLNICSHTKDGIDPSADWWMFQFSFELAYITDITIYYRTEFAYRMDGFKIYVTNTSAIPPNGYLCYEDSDPGLPNITQNIPCYESGKYVIYYDATGDELYGPVVELCYVAINGCPKGMWGPNCTESCSSICINQHCHPENGSCIWGCDPQRCINGRCDTHTGFCTEGCVTGWIGQYCTCGKFAYRPDGFKLYVTNTSIIQPVGYLCYEDSDPGLPNINQNIPCYKSGKYVIYYDTTGDDLFGPVVQRCYVAINGCPKGMWEPNCTESCSSICIGKQLLS